MMKSIVIGGLLMIEAFAHQEFPFEELGRTLESDVGLARQSMCQVFLVINIDILKLEKLLVSLLLLLIYDFQNRMKHCGEHLQSDVLVYSDVN
jgi:hypothetical protein